MVIPWETLKREPVSTIPRKGSRADFVTARNGVPTKVGKIQSVLLEIIDPYDSRDSSWLTKRRTKRNFGQWKLWMLRKPYG